MPLTELPNDIMHEHSVLQLLKEVLCAQTTNTLLLGIFGAILFRKSLLGRQGRDLIDTVGVGKALWCCASCGIAESNGAKLKNCDNCDLVRYCSDECLQYHRPQHEAVCKERAAELRDELLFKQPESSHVGDCPICCLPLPLDPNKYLLFGCCCKIVCAGCNYANHVREEDQKLDPTCPFCRHPIPENEEEDELNEKKRVDANDPVALRQMGVRLFYKKDYDAKHFGKQDYERAFEYYTKAAELGDADAHHNLSIMYMKGHGVEKDEEKEIFHLEEASIAGHPSARFSLGCHEVRNERYENAVKHFVIAAHLGCDESIPMLKEGYKTGYVSKDDFAAALRGHHSAVAATKSTQREVGEKVMAAARKGTFRWTLNSQIHGSGAP